VDEVPAQLEPLKVAWIEVILLALDDILWRGPQPDLEALFQLLYKEGAMVETIMPPLVKAVFGLPVAGNDKADRQPTETLAEAILAILGERVRIVHGRFECLYGILGSGGRFTYGTQIPGFGGMIRTLLTLEPGTAEKLSVLLR
jgi:hypothetical protein